MGLVELTESFSWEGRRIAWARAGSGPAVVFCHGTPFSSRVWAPYAEALADRFTVHLWDLPGYGRSSMDPEHRVAADVHAQAFKALLDHWGLDRPQVVAHDLGGLVSLRAHLVEGAAYASLFLVDVVAIPPSGSPFFRFVQENPALLPQLPAYIHEAIVRAYVGNATYRGLSPEELDALVASRGRRARASPRSTGRSPTTTSSSSTRTSAAPASSSSRSGSSGAPRTPGSRWRPGAGSLRWCRAHLTEVPEAGHLMQYDAPVALATALSDWLDPTA